MFDYMVLNNTGGVEDLLTKVIASITGIGASVFTLAVLIIALCIIFGSISPKNIGKWWTALFSCIAGAVIFFGANLLKTTIAGLF
ncbi:MAG: TrbC/VirB2 family protein [Solibacillus sp.]